MRIVRWLPALALIVLSAAQAGKALVRRDVWGIPHIKADDEPAAAYALGYCQAEDRLEQLFENYRKAVGCMAEAFGERYLQHDLLQRTWRHEQVARRYLETEAPPEIVVLARAFQDGVRAFMKAHPDRVPASALEMHPYHVAALGRYIIYGWQVEQLAQELGRVPGARLRLYSNEFAIAPRRVKEKCAVLYIDPHLPWEGEFRFYENHVEAGALKTCGFSVAGTPMIGLGHNAYLGWACTTGGPDTADVYELPRNPAQPWQYRYEGEWREVIKETVSIACKNPDGTLKQVSRVIYRTHHGPVIFDTPEKLYVAKTAYDDQAGVATQLYRMNRARNLKEFMAAIALFQLMDQNIMGADIEGNIFYVRNGRVPIRPKGHDWSRPVPGDTRQTEWQGFHPLDDLVQIVNPTTGYMQNCNVAPDAMAHVPLVRAGDYLPELFHARPGDTHSRGLRANQLLSQHDNLGREEAFRLVADTELPAIPRWKEYLRQAQPDLAGDDDARRFCELLADWNGRVDKDQPGATAFEHLIYELIELGGWGRIGPEVINRVERLEEEQRARLVKAIRRASARLLKNFGTLRVPWGDIHRIERNGSWPVDGAGIRFYATLRPAGYGPPDAQHKRAANSGQSHAMLVFLKPGAVESFSVTPFGISDRPESPHYNDQTRELFSPNRLKPTWFNERDLAQHVERTYELSYQP